MAGPVAAPIVPDSPSPGDADEKLDRPTRWRVALWLVILGAGLGCVVYFAWLWGEGDNLWRKILASWQFFALVFVVCLGCFLLHSGKKGQRLYKRWHGDDK